MLPLTLANKDEPGLIRHVGGGPEMKRRLADLGFVAGTGITVIAANGGNLIVHIRDSRVAISRELASKIMI